MTNGSSILMFDIIWFELTWIVFSIALPLNKLQNFLFIVGIGVPSIGSIVGIVGCIVGTYVGSIVSWMGGIGVGVVGLDVGFTVTGWIWDQMSLW